MLYSYIFCTELCCPSVPHRALCPLLPEKTLFVTSGQVGLNCTALHSTAQYVDILYYTSLHCTVLCFTKLACTNVTQILPETQIQTVFSSPHSPGKTLHFTQTGHLLANNILKITFDFFLNQILMYSSLPPTILFMTRC